MGDRRRRPTGVKVFALLLVRNWRLGRLERA
jgi:hypothetical protein